MATAALQTVLTPERVLALKELAAKYGVRDLRVFGMKVDVLTQDALDQKLHARIFREARPL